MTDAVWPAKCRHLSKPGAIALEAYAVVTLRNVPAWRGKLHLEIDFECELCPLCAGAVTHSVGELGRVRPTSVDVHCTACDMLCVVSSEWLSLACPQCGHIMVNE